MFNGGYAGEDGVLDALRGVGVGFDAESERGGFFDGGAQFFHSEFLGVGIAAVFEDGAGGENFDMVRAVVGELADYGANFPGAVGLAVAQIPRQLNVWCCAG